VRSAQEARGGRGAPRSEHGVGLAGEHRPQQGRQIAGIALQAGGLHDRDVAGRERDAARHGRHRGGARTVLDDPHAGRIRGAILKEYKIRVQDLSGRRGGPDEPFELVFHVRLRNSQQAPEMLERVSQVPGVKDWSQISH